MSDIEPDRGTTVPQQPRRRRRLRRLAMILAVVLAAIAVWLARDLFPLTQEDRDNRVIAIERAERWSYAKVGQPLPGAPELSNLKTRLAEQGLVQGAPVLIRIFKREFALELWMLKEGKFRRFATYPICMWSGKLGPKLKTGDGQSPEGFYSVSRSALNPNSKYYRSFNLGFPNRYDESQGRTGSLLMVHGNCLSIGCYAMTDAQMDEIWRLVTSALDGGQAAFQVQIYPFRMSETALSAYAGHANEAFWRDLKSGNDIFEATLEPPQVHVCDGRYQFAPRAGGKGEAGETRDSCSSASAAK